MAASTQLTCAGSSRHQVVDVVIEPTPGTCCLSPGGLHPDDIVRWASAVAKVRPICALDIMEVAQRRSATDLTAIVAVELMLRLSHIALNSLVQHSKALLEYRTSI